MLIKFFIYYYYYILNMGKNIQKSIVNNFSIFYKKELNIYIIYYLINININTMNFFLYISLY